jgi:hypothetical protein
MHTRATALAVVLVLSCLGPAAHAVPGEAAVRASRGIALRGFRKAVRSSSGLATAHTWNLTKAAAKSAGKGLVAGLVGTILFYGRPFFTPPAALAPWVAGATTLAGGVWSYRRDDLPAARTDTVARGVAEGKIAPELAKRWEAAEIINGDWK